MSMTFLVSKPFLINKQSSGNAVRVEHSAGSSDIFKAPEHFKSDLDRLHTCISDAIAANHEVMVTFESHPYFDFDSGSEDYEEWIIENIRGVHKDVSIEGLDPILPTWMTSDDCDPSIDDDGDF